MALKIRLRQQGSNNRPSYRLVVADVRSPRDGKYVESLGWYNPFGNGVEQTLNLYADRIQHWLNVGAQLTDSARHLVAQAAPELLRKEVQKVTALRAKKAAKRRMARKAS